MILSIIQHHCQSKKWGLINQDKRTLFSEFPRLIVEKIPLIDILLIFKMHDWQKMAIVIIYDSKISLLKLKNKRCVTELFDKLLLGYINLLC